MLLLFSFGQKSSSKVMFTSIKVAVRLRQTDFDLTLLPPVVQPQYQQQIFLHEQQLSLILIKKP